MIDIQHNIRQQKFFTEIKNVEYSLEYNEVERGLLEFHCSVDAGLNKEKEIREKLIEYALAYMSRNGLKMLESGSCHQFTEVFETKKSFEHLKVCYID